jgi:hypothetical protein
VSTGQRTSSVGYETSDAAPRLLAALAAGMAAFIFLTPLALQAMNPVTERTADLSKRPPAPRLQIDAKADLARLKQDERSQRDVVGWVDRDQNIVRVPVSQAMQLIARRGLFGWPAGTADVDQPKR